MNQLSPKQTRIYEFILSFTEQNGYPPSVREIADAVGLKSPSTVHFHLKSLEEAGVITRGAGKTRAITAVHRVELPENRGAPAGRRGRRRPHSGSGVRGGVCPLRHQRRGLLCPAHPRREYAEGGHPARRPGHRPPSGDPPSTARSSSPSSGTRPPASATPAKTAMSGCCRRTTTISPSTAPLPASSARWSDFSGATDRRRPWIRTNQPFSVSGRRIRATCSSA